MHWHCEQVALRDCYLNENLTRFQASGQCYSSPIKLMWMTFEHLMFITTR